MTRFLRDLSVGAVLFLLAGVTSWAQATAELNGRVTDESGAVLPGVTVTATQIDAGFTRTVVTEGSGDRTGAYRVSSTRARAAGSR